MQDPYQFAARQPRSSQPFVVKLATAVVEVPCQVVVVRLEDHDAIACPLEAMDDGSPLLIPVFDRYTDRSDYALPMTRPQPFIKVLKSQYCSE
jgi:hypothetical protein